MPKDVNKKLCERYIQEQIRLYVLLDTPLYRQNQTEKKFDKKSSTNFNYEF